MRKLALCVGATQLNPAAYGGWPGTCPGCDRDCMDVSVIAHTASKFRSTAFAANFDGVETLINARATRANVASAFRSFAADLRNGDLLLVFFSGHGGQLPDRDGDEADGLDETLCLYDGEVVDDTVAEFFGTLRRGVASLFVTDSCNSGTNFKGRRGKPSPVAIGPITRGAVRGPLLHLGGCTDGRFSYGDEDGGMMTTATTAAIKRARKPLTYRELARRIAANMPSVQRPAFSIVGDDSYADRVLFN